MMIDYYDEAEKFADKETDNFYLHLSKFNGFMKNASDKEIESFKLALHEGIRYGYYSASIKGVK